MVPFLGSLPFPSERCLYQSVQDVELNLDLLPSYPRRMKIHLREAKWTSNTFHELC